MADTTTTDRTELVPLSPEERAELRAIAEAAQQGRWWWGGDIGNHRGDVELHAVVPGSGCGVVDILRQLPVERTPTMADKMVDQAREHIDDEDELKAIRKEWLTDSYGQRRTDNRLAFADPENHFVTPGRELAVFEVARNQGLPDNTPADHPKVYRHDVVDVRNVNARHIVAARPEIVLRLLADLDRAEHATSAALESGEKGLNSCLRGRRSSAQQVGMRPPTMDR